MNQCFLLLFLIDVRRIRSLIRIREAQKYMDPMDPDPQHWLEQPVHDKLK